MIADKELLPNLFRTEYRKIVSVLAALFGMEHIEVAEDIVSDTFLSAAELWGLKGLPENPTAWLYTVAKNKTKDYLKHHHIFARKVSPELQYNSSISAEMEIDLSPKNINDSQLAMIFAVCNPCIATEAQIGLALNLLCGFAATEIANAFLTNKDIIYKRLQRAKGKLKEEQIRIGQPSLEEINDRLPNVLTTLYLLFNEGYHSSSNDKVIRKELCLEAMRLCYLLVENEITNRASANALLSLMCFHASRFEARTDQTGAIILYDDQDTNLWDKELIKKGAYFLDRAYAKGNLTKYHLEAGIAFHHTQRAETDHKWEAILQLYNDLLLMEYSPIAALNRTYALAKANGKQVAIVEAEQLNLSDNHFYHSLLGNLYSDLDNEKALQHFQKALMLANSAADKAAITKNIGKLTQIISPI